MKHLLFIIHCSLFIVFLTGCGNQHKLGGKVSFPDGSPLTCGTIILSNDTFLARANINPDGTYDVGSFSEKDGLPPGKYKVYITGAVTVAGKKKSKQTVVTEDGKTKTIEVEEDILESLIAGKFTGRETTPLEIEVPGEKAFNITVEKP
ncbi:MAG: carboxypeptidase-like regulatory domain-containing protein [Planctomycetaceae bacterium]|jgi:hypothetical protein|nr:carboxypeptidase-like regulatory domain-containing protein [Planctomycetaceae bacterium]